MTPNTAAALRALEQKWRGRGDAGSYKCADELAAVLTQEGAGIHPATRDLVERFSGALLDKLAAAEKKYGYSDGWASPSWMDECRTKLREHVAKGDPRDVAAYCAFLWHHNESTAEPRAAEGGGMDGVVRPLSSPDDLTFSGEPKTLEELRAELEPTAAAAVPAGGDAVAWRLWWTERTTNLRMRGLYNMRDIAEATRQVLKDAGHHSFVTEPLFATPAPRGGVTEAMIDAAFKAAEWDQIDDEDRDLMRRAIKAALEAALSPAAQAQDAGEHISVKLFEDAFNEAAKRYPQHMPAIVFLHAACGPLGKLTEKDVQDAVRALAAKEAK